MPLCANLVCASLEGARRRLQPSVAPAIDLRAPCTHKDPPGRIHTPNEGVTATVTPSSAPLAAPVSTHIRRLQDTASATSPALRESPTPRPTIATTTTTVGGGVNAGWVAGDETRRSAS